MTPPRPAPDTSPEWLASILHELRNPLSATMAHAEMLAEGIYGPLAASQTKAVQTLRLQLHQAFRLLDDLGEVWLERTSPNAEAFTTCDCRLLCDHALERNQALVQSRSLQVEIAVPQEGSVFLSSEVVDFDKLVSGLLACALHLVAKGSHVRLGLEAGQAGIFLGLQADGIGAQSPDDELLDTALAQLMRIKPIGLLLLRRWAAQVGAQLIAYPTSGGYPALGLLLPNDLFSSKCPDPSSGARPTPVAEVPEVSVSPTFSQAGEPPLILIADDQVALTTVVQTYLEDLGLKVLVAADGRQAIQHALADRPRLIIMDVRMPLMDGLQALETIRSSADPMIASTPVICVSGYAAPGEQERCLNAGATAFLRKPFGVRHLLDLVTRFFPELGVSPP